MGVLDELTNATDAIARAKALYLREQVPASTVRAGQSLQAAIDAAQPGTALALEPGIWNEAITGNKAVAISGAGTGDGRATRDQASWIVSPGDGVTVTADGFSMACIGVKSMNPDRQLVAVTGGKFSADRCTLLGDPTKGQHRGIMLNGIGAVVTRCFVDDVFLIGREAQAIGGWDGTKDVVIENNYLSASSQSILFGGADSAGADRVPRNIQVTRNTLTRNLKWYSIGALVKAPFELKSAIGVRCSDNVMEYAGISQGQGAYLIVLTVRNQDGTAPWSTIEDIVVERNLCRHGGGAVNFLGRDNGNKSGVMRNVVVRHCMFDDVDPKSGPWQGAGRGFLFDGAPDNVTIDSCTVQTKGTIGASMYFIPPPPTKMILRNLKIPAQGTGPGQAEYGIKIDAGGMGLVALQKFAPDAILEHVNDGTGAIGYPANV